MSKFSLGEKVSIKVSNEAGEVSALFQRIGGQPQYEVHYKAVDGKATSAWYEETQLERLA